MRWMAGGILFVVLVISCARDASPAESDTEQTADAAPPGESEALPAGTRFQRPGYRRAGEPERGGLPFRRPGEPPETDSEREPLPPPLPAPQYEYVSVPDRWRIVESLGVNERVWDPYHQSTLKGDRPIFGTQDWFFNLALVSDALVEARRLPTPVGAQANRRSGSLDIFGDDEQLAVVENLIFTLSLIQGDTVFRPPDWEFRFTGVGNFNYTKAEVLGLLRIDPTRGRDRYDDHFAIQELFADRHLWNKSDRYDFDSVRVGIQPFISDFRGFLFEDNPLGARLFGTFQNNRIQYNLAWFRRIEKDTNSGLNRVIDLRDDDVFVANLYYQDFPILGFTLQGTVVYNRNDESGDTHFNRNGFLERPAPFGDARPHDYDVVYLGLNGDGHFDRLNLTFSVYWALGNDDRNPIAQRSQDINAVFAALEASMDFDWYRLKMFGLYASGDKHPFDDKATGFDAIFENPQFAGADTGFWQRQSIPFIGGGGVILSGRNALIPSLRTSKGEGQSNFVNPGLGLVGVGADFDILPELRLIANATWLTFANTSSLQALRVQGPIDKNIGYDVSAGLVYRPLFIENVVFRFSGAVLFPESGMRDLFDATGQHSPFYSVLANLILTY
jgi:hypothetical protein